MAGVELGRPDCGADLPPTRCCPAIQRPRRLATRACPLAHPDQPERGQLLGGRGARTSPVACPKALCVRNRYGTSRRRLKVTLLSCGQTPIPTTSDKTSQRSPSLPPACGSRPEPFNDRSDQPLCQTPTALGKIEILTPTVIFGKDHPMNARAYRWQTFLLITSLLGQDAQ
jgi:hypothetical protein